MPSYDVHPWQIELDQSSRAQSFFNSQIICIDIIYREKHEFVRAAAISPLFLFPILYGFRSLDGATGLSSNAPF